MAEQKEKLTFIVAALDKASAPFKRMANAANKMAAPFRRMALQFKQLGKNLGFDRIGKAAGKMKTAFADLGRAAFRLVAPLGALGFALVSTATSMRQLEAQAASVGLSTDALLGYQGAIQDLGFDAEKVVDLVEEMNNKIGESKGLGATTPVKEALHMLKLDMREIAALKSEEQFERIMDAAAKMQDQQKAVSAVDILMGGDANKIMGSLRVKAKEQGVTVKELLAQYRAMNLTTKEGRAGLQVFYQAWQKLTTVAKSGFTELLGLIGEKLAPMLERMSTWIMDNFDDIKTAFVDGLPHAIETVIAAFKGLKRAVAPIGDFFSWMSKTIGVENTVMVTFAAIVSMIVVPAIAGLAIAFIALGNAIYATPVGWIAGAIMGLVAVGTFLYAKWEKVTELWKEYSDLLYMTPLAPFKIMVDLVVSLIGHWDALINKIQHNWKIIKNFGNMLGSVYNSVFGNDDEESSAKASGGVAQYRDQARAGRAATMSRSEHTSNARVLVDVNAPQGSSMSMSGDADITGRLNTGPILAGL